MFPETKCLMKIFYSTDIYETIFVLLCPVQNWTNPKWFAEFSSFKQRKCYPFFRLILPYRSLAGCIRTSGTLHRLQPSLHLKNISSERKSSKVSIMRRCASRYFLNTKGSKSSRVMRESHFTMESNKQFKGSHVFELQLTPIIHYRIEHYLVTLTRYPVLRELSQLYVVVW